MDLTNGVVGTSDVTTISDEMSFNDDWMMDLKMRPRGSGDRSCKVFAQIYL